MTPLHWAAMQGRKDMAELLIANRADINAKNKYGATPLHVAVLSGRENVEELLRQHGGRE
jgi:ankyrin repeat protein